MRRDFVGQVERTCFRSRPRRCRLPPSPGCPLSPAAASRAAAGRHWPLRRRRPPRAVASGNLTTLGRSRITTQESRYRQTRRPILRIRPIALSVALLFALIIPPQLKAENAPAKAGDYERLLQQIFRSIENNYVDQVDAKKLFAGALKGMFDALDDPHSYYLSQTDLKDLTDTTSGEFGGVGLIISKPIKVGDPGPEATATPPRTPPYVEVVSPIHGTPAYRAGISAGDLITRIGEESTERMTIDEVVNKLRGAPGTKVTVTVLRGSNISFNVTINRAIIEVPVVTSAMIPEAIGYMRIIQYTPLTLDKVRDAVRSLADQGATSLIIDERGNPGGLLSAVVKTSDLFLSAGTIVTTQSRISGESAIYSASPDVLVPASLPIIVLIDKGSASAAEIFAAALRDNGRALLVGETSYGKGSVQQIFFLREGDGAFKLTTAKYYTPAGVNIDKVGITPDVIVAEPPLTQAEQDSLKKLLEGNLISTFVRENPGAGDAETLAFVTKLRQEGFLLQESTLLQLVQSEQDRMQNDPPVYDLRYDRVLSEAVRLLTTGAYPKKGN